MRKPRKQTTDSFIVQIAQEHTEYAEVEVFATNSALPQKSDYRTTFGANGISAPKIILTDWSDLAEDIGSG